MPYLLLLASHTREARGSGRTLTLAADDQVGLSFGHDAEAEHRPEGVKQSPLRRRRAPVEPFAGHSPSRTAARRAETGQAAATVARARAVRTSILSVSMS